MGKNVSVRKTSKITFVVYGIIILLIIIACLFVGSAMDYAVNPYGKIDINLMENGFNRVLSNPYLLLSSLKNKNGYAPKMLFLGIASTALYVLYKYSEEKKRFHRRGVEHGSAKWGDEKEMKSLADKEKPFTFIDTGNVLRYTPEEAIDNALNHLDYFIGNSKGIAKSLLREANLPEGMTEKQALELVTKGLNEKVQNSVNPVINPTANSNPLMITIENFNNNRQSDIQALAEELEFYRKNAALAKGES